MTMITSNVWEIEKEIRLHGHIEWRSKKNLDDYVLNNRFDKDISIVGYITPRTIEKWGVKLYRESITKPKDHDVYVAVKNNRICYLHGLAIPKPIDYSRYW